MVSDVELAGRATRGDRDAYAELVERHRNVAFRVAYLVTGSEADAEDATQEAFVKAFLKINRYRPGAPFRPWLLKIVGNEARNHRRSEGRRAHYQAKEASMADHRIASDPPLEGAARADLHRRMLAAVNSLPEEERVVIGLRYFLDLSEAETAVAAGVPKGTVKSRTARAMSRLEQLLGDLNV